MRRTEFEDKCNEFLNDYLNEGWKQGETDVSPADCMFAAATESFNNPAYASLGMDVLLKSAAKAELAGKKLERDALLNDFARESLRGAINYMLQMAADDVNNVMNDNYDALTHKVEA